MKQELPQRKPNRLKNRDYSDGGAYFLTICTAERRNHFWHNVGATIGRPQDVKLSSCGMVVDEAIKQIPIAYPSISVESYVIMPDHVHLLLRVRVDECGRPMVAPTMSRVVQQLKGYVTKKVGFSIWQKLFFDHVIRNQQDFDEHLKYIYENPSVWHSDEEIGGKMKSINNNIKYLPSSKEPLSADVYFIEGEKNCYIYDVGNNTDSLMSINRVSRGKNVILSHYHKDHTGNIEQIKCDALYVGRRTHEIIKKGEIVEENITINDGIKIEIIPCTSPHTDGSLIVNINNEYALIADLYFTRPPFDTEKAKLMVEHLKNIDTKYFVISHLEDEKIVPKKKMITELSEYFKH